MFKGNILKTKINKRAKDEQGNIKETVKKLLFKKANGFLLEEVTEEYGQDAFSGEMKIIKKKVTAKEIEPDLSAIKMLLELFDEQTDLTKMTDEEINEQKQKLFRLMKEEGQFDD